MHHGLHPELLGALPFQNSNLAMRILTYTSSLALPPTIFTSRTLLQNTQTKLSYTHIYFTDSTAAGPACDLLAVDSSSLKAEDLEVAKAGYNRTIIWSSDIVNAVLWFVESFDADPSKCYLVVGARDGFTAHERDVADHTSSPEPHVDVSTHEEREGQRYLQNKFRELQEEDRVVQKIFSRLSLMQGKKKQ
jgi:hypothetical protein